MVAGVEVTFADLAQRDARELAGRLADGLRRVDALLDEAQGLAGAIDAKVGVASPLGLAPTYPGLTGPVIAVLRAAIDRWKSLNERIR